MFWFNTIFVKFDSFHIFMQSYSYFITHICYSLFLYSSYLSNWNPQSYTEKKGYTRATKNRSWVFPVFCFEWDSVHLVSHSFYSSSVSEMPYPIQFLHFPRHWMKALSVPDFLFHFVNKNRCEFVQVLHCYW